MWCIIFGFVRISVNFLTFDFCNRHKGKSEISEISEIVLRVVDLVWKRFVLLQWLFTLWCPSVLSAISIETKKCALVKVLELQKCVLSNVNLAILIPNSRFPPAAGDVSRHRHGTVHEAVCDFMRSQLLVKCLQSCQDLCRKTKQTDLNFQQTTEILITGQQKCCWTPPEVYISAAHADGVSLPGLDGWFCTCKKTVCQGHETDSLVQKRFKWQTLQVLSFLHELQIGTWFLCCRKGNVHFPVEEMRCVELSACEVRVEGNSAGAFFALCRRSRPL